MTGRLRTKRRGAGPEGERADHKPPAAPGALGGAARTTYHLCRERPSISNGSRGSSRAPSPGRAEELRLAPGSPRGNRGWGAPRGGPAGGRDGCPRARRDAPGQREAPQLGSQLPRKGFLALGAGRVIAIAVDPAIAERLSARSERTSPWSEARCAEQGASPAPPTLALGGPRESSPVFAGARGQGRRPGRGSEPGSCVGIWS